MLRHFQEENHKFGNDCKDNFILNLLDPECAISVGYPSANEHASYITTMDADGVAKIIKNDNDVDSYGQEPNSFAISFEMIYEILPDTRAVIVTNGTYSDAPSVDFDFEVGTNEHATEICACLHEIKDDIFLTTDKSGTFIVICKDAEHTAISAVLEKCCAA